MDREIVLLILILVTVGPVTWMASLLWPMPRLPSRGSAGAEPAAWFSLWAPFVPAAAIVGALVGWATFEPRNAEVVPLTLYPFAGATVYVCLRAIGRARRALAVHDAAPAYTHGLWRPRIVFSTDLVSHFSPIEFEAAQAHEQAHVRHRDPLRLWVAQLWTDLQWPHRSAEQRFRAWRHALELARDDEARQGGIDGADLAAAVIAAAQFGRRAAPGAVELGWGYSDAAAFRQRINRLLAPLDVSPDPSVTGTSRVWLPLAIATAVLMITAGEALGERVVGVVCRTLP